MRIYKVSYIYDESSRWIDLDNVASISELEENGSSFTIHFKWNIPPILVWVYCNEDIDDSIKAAKQEHDNLMKAWKGK